MPSTKLDSPTQSPTGIFASIHCCQLDLRYQITRDKFAVQPFLAFFKRTEEEGFSHMSATCRTLDPERLDYHLHFQWEFRKEELVFYISFHVGAIGPGEDEHEPYAEQFMQWLGKFFSNESAQGDVHAEFRYSGTRRQSRFPLPLKTNLSDDLEAEITGIAMAFPAEPLGVARAQVNQSPIKKHLTVDVSGLTRTTFAAFDLESELNTLSSVALLLTEEKDVK